MKEPTDTTSLKLSPKKRSTHLAAKKGAEVMTSARVFTEFEKTQAHVRKELGVLN